MSGGIKTLFIRKGRSGTLHPVGEDATRVMKSIKPDEKVLVTVHRARYPEHHRLVMAVVSKIAEAMGVAHNVILLWLKWETGLIDIVELPNGMRCHDPRSISFESMGQDEFQEWWNDALIVIKEKMLPKLNAREFRQVRDIITGERKAA